MQVNKEKKAETESLQAQYATAKRACETAERRAADLTRELTAAKARVNELADSLQSAKGDSAALASLSKRMSALPASMAPGEALPQKVRRGCCVRPNTQSLSCSMLACWIYPK
jgi:DNA repair exonuclease SbcCD ATPase subunit